MSELPPIRPANALPPASPSRRKLRPERSLPSAPLPAGPRAERPLPDPSDWSFELVEQYHEKIRAAAARFALDTYPNQLEVITAEQMMDAYASVGMPVNYRHWSYGKEFIANERSYRRGQMGLAYEIVINSDPCISYLMEENTTAMQALVIAHAAYGHNSFFKGNYLFRLWTDASSIIDRERDGARAKGRGGWARRPAPRGGSGARDRRGRRGRQTRKDRGEAGGGGGERWRGSGEREERGEGRAERRGSCGGSGGLVAPPPPPGGGGGPGGEGEDLAGVHDVFRVERALDRSHHVDRAGAGFVDQEVHLVQADAVLAAAGAVHRQGAHHQRFVQPLGGLALARDVRSTR